MFNSGKKKNLFDQEAKRQVSASFVSNLSTVALLKAKLIKKTKTVLLSIRAIIKVTNVRIPLHSKLDQTVSNGRKLWSV